MVGFASRRRAARQAPLRGIGGRSWGFRASAAKVTTALGLSVAVTRPRGPGMSASYPPEPMPPRPRGASVPPGSTGSRKLLGKGYYLASSRFRRRTKLRRAGANHTADSTAREPRMSQTPTWDADRALSRIRELEHLPGALLPILHALQEEFGYIDSAAVPLVARALNLSHADVHGVISFYHDFRHTRPQAAMCCASAAPRRARQWGAKGWSRTLRSAWT